MNNIIIVAKKEFADLLNSWLVIVVLLVFLLMIVISLHNLHDLVAFQNGESSGRFLQLMVGGLWNVLSYYGMFLGIIIGFVSIASERHNGALNTLLMKPLYRDSIINGKLLGCICFVISVLIIVTILFTSGIFILWGNSFSRILLDYIEAVPEVLFLSVVYVLMFASLSMLLSLLIKNLAVALIGMFLLMFVFDIGQGMNIAGFISTMISPTDIGLQETIAGLSPLAASHRIGLLMCPPPMPNGLPGTVSFSFSLESLILELFIYLALSMVTSYAIFIRRDIS
jgi:ABC-2 type transport system permease protein